jgi:hypothetical protein
MPSDTRADSNKGDSMKDVVISKEYLEKIRRFAAIHPEETFRYTPLVFRDMEEDLRPVFTLKPVSGEKVWRYSDEMSGEVSTANGVMNVKVQRGKFLVNVIKEGLVKWENYYDVDGKEVTFKNGIDCLPKDLIEELAQAILKRASLTEEEVLGLK